MTDGILGISLRRHLGLRSLLWHSGKTNNTTYCTLGIIGGGIRHHADPKLLLGP